MLLSQELRPLLLVFPHPPGVALSRPQDGPAGTQPAGTNEQGEVAGAAAVAASKLAPGTEDRLFGEPWWMACSGARDAAW